jgi:hypothetical protein
MIVMSNEELQSTVDYEQTRLALKVFLEKRPLYSKIRVKLPDLFSQSIPEVVFLSCSTCGATTPFRDQRSRGGGAGMPPPPKRDSGVRFLCYTCTGCRKDMFECWVEVNYENEEWIRKVGQLPMWLPEIPADLKQELGEDAEIYQKASRNLAEGYGIGACAYLRRLLEKYINPLLKLLYELKENQGATEEELIRIQGAIEAKDFTAKTKFASEIAPGSLLVGGHNPLKEVHERLSVGLHLLDEETASECAMKIRNALEFIVRRLRRELDERKAYAATLRTIRDLPVE